MTQQPLPVTEAEAEAFAAQFLAQHDLTGEVVLETEGDEASVVIPPS